MGRLVRRRDGVNHTLAIDQVIGRLSSCALRLDNQMVSGVHALIRWHEEGWEIRDLGSQNGTKVGARRLAAGETARLARGVSLTFGDSQETWELADAREPQVQVVPLDGAPPLPLRNDMIALPSEDDPQYTIYRRTDLTWELDSGGETRPLQHDELFWVGGRKMRFEAPPEGSRTPPISTRPVQLRSVALCFRVSSDEEHVELVVEAPNGTRSLGCRSSFYLGLVLARQRLEDTAQEVADPGWVTVSKVLRMIPEYATQSHLNVDVHRLRRELATAGIVDAANFIERRRGRLRIGASSIRVEHDD